MVRRKTRVHTRASSPTSLKSNQTSILVPKNRRKRSTARALQEIKYYRRITSLLIPKAPFARLVRQILYELFPRSDIRKIQVLALEAMQESAEMYLTQFFEDAVLLALHSKRVTLMQRDMVLMRRLRGRADIINR